jgi:hypothetical protein
MSSLTENNPGWSIFKKFPELVYLYLFTQHFLHSKFAWQWHTFANVWKSFWKPFSNNSVSAFLAFEVNSLHFCFVALSECTLVMETGKVRQWQVREIWWMLQQSSHIVHGKASFYHRQPTGRCVVMHKKPTVSCPFFQMFPYHCIPEAMEDFHSHLFVYSMPFWNKFKLDVDAICRS